MTLANPERMRLNAKKRTILVSLLLVFSFTTPTGAVQAQQPQRNDKQTLDEVRKAYSMLKHQGLIGIEATVIPVWDHLLTSVSPQQRTRVLQLIKRLRFSMSINAAGALNVNHRVIGPKPDKATRDLLEDMAKGVELSTQGFIMSWAPIMLTYLIPDRLDSFVLQDLGSEYLLSFNDNGTDVSIAMTKDLVIKEVRSPFGAVRPSLVRTSKGYLLTGYEASYVDPTSGAGTLKVTLLSQDIQGMQLPSRVTLKSTMGGTFGKVELLFTKYQLKTTARAAR